MPSASDSALIVVADAEGPARDLALSLRAAGHAVETCASLKVLRRLARERDVACLVCDREGAGFDPLDEIGSFAAPPAVVELSAFGSVEEAVERIRRGAFDYLLKPVTDEQIQVSVARALEQGRLRAENAELKRTLERRFELGNVVSRDPRIQRVLQAIDALSDTRATILLEGESGTGKTLFARTIHQRSTRAPGPFVELNCGAIPDGLLESELFGHARGSFTGAVKDKPGKFESADGGTLFLDEIGVASNDLQVKLLRAIQDRTFERVGENRARTVDVRIVAATNANLAEAVRAGRFREDLYYRLRVVTFELPPLRARPGDVPLLAERFLERFATEHGRDRKRLGSPALAALVAHDWPGNVRELEHCLERALLLAPGPEIAPEDLGLDGAARRASGSDPRAPLPGAAPDLVPGTSLKAALDGPEREIIRRALILCGGSRKETARLLDVNRTTLFNKMKKHDLMEFVVDPE